jgi:glycine/D-amino acid oxidase-like deaminating enzyme
MAWLFPDLAGVRVARAWSGQLAFAFDHLPHIGEDDGLHYALGCNGSGLVMLTHFGRRIGQRIAGKADGPSAFAALTFPSHPLYTGHAWFMPLIATWYGWRDRLEM